METREGTPPEARLRVAVVDDDPPVRRTLATILERRLGAAVVTGESDADAMELRLAERLDAMVLDARMPGIGGVAALAEIRRLEASLRLPRLPVLLFTASPDELEAGLAAGADAALLKPAAPSDVAAEVARLAAAGAAASRHDKPEPPPEPGL